MESILRPTREDTSTDGGGRIWRPATAQSALAELRALQQAGETQVLPLLFRGQSSAKWYIDSKFARTIKQELLGFEAGTVPTFDAANNIHFFNILHAAFHFKYGVMIKPGDDLFEAEKKEPRFDPWFEMMRAGQQYPLRHDLKKPCGSFLIDWSLSAEVAAWFAASTMPEEVGAVCVWNAGSIGPKLVIRKLAGHLETMQSHNFASGPIDAMPLIFCPELQSVHLRAKAQKAIYVAQTDLRWPLDVVFMEIERALGTIVFVKIELSPKIKKDMLALLAEAGIDEKTIYPDEDSELP